MVVTLGYVNAAGGHDEVVVSPAAGSMTVAQRRDLVAGALAVTGSAPVWVDGTPAGLVAAVAAKLGVPVGKPDGWAPVAPSIPVDTSGFPPPPDPSMMDAAI